MTRCVTRIPGLVCLVQDDSTSKTRSSCSVLFLYVHPYPPVGTSLPFNSHRKPPTVKFASPYSSRLILLRWTPLLSRPHTPIRWVERLPFKKSFVSLFSFQHLCLLRRTGFRHPRSHGPSHCYSWLPPTVGGTSPEGR